MDKNSSGGLTLPSVLQIIFIVLKLTGNINWSWFWVLVPAWIGIIDVLIAVLIVKVFIK